MPAESQLTASPMMQIDAIVTMTPKASALSGSITPIGIGRPRVRSMIASISRSYHMLIAPAPPVASAIARTATAASTGFIGVSAATRPASPVKTTSDITRGFSRVR